MTPASIHARGKFGSASAWLLFLAALLFLGRLELHTDDSGVVAVVVLGAAFVLSCLHPGRAWLWSLTGWSVPAADLLRGSPAPDVHHIPGPLLLLAFLTALGLAGSYSGVLFRRLTGGRSTG